MYVVSARLLLVLTILDSVYRLVESVDGHSQAFIQTDSELRYLVDGISIHLPEELASSKTGNKNEYNIYSSPIRFDPPLLDFKEQPVGMPRLENIMVLNPVDDVTVQLLSISGSTSHFHCSFFQDKVLPPGSNTTFEIVFLARHEGQVENTLYIHTSIGSFKYEVQGVGTPNPYRLKPFVGVRVPLNSSYSPLITLHNPHSSTLQVTEIYSSGGDLHLDLPLGENEAQQQIWQIPPYETRAVMRASFVGRTENNYTVYIRIKTNHSEENLVLPFEVEIQSQPGIYSPSNSLDFGILRSHDEPRPLQLTLLNYGNKHINIQSVVVTPPNDAVQIAFQPIKVSPETINSAPVAIITFDPKKVSSIKQCTGKIVVKSKNGQFKLSVPYQATLLNGSLAHDTCATTYHIGSNMAESRTSFVRDLTLTNLFNLTLVIYDYILAADAQAYFTVSDFKPLVLQYNETGVLSKLVFSTPLNGDTQVVSFMRLLSNISTFDVPLLVYSGRLKRVRSDPLSRETHLEFGTIAIEEQRSSVFAFVNENPIDISLKGWGSNMTGTLVELLGVGEGGNLTEMLLRKKDITNLTKQKVVRPKQYVIFKLQLTAPDHEGSYIGHVFLDTQLESLRIPFTFRVAKGNLVAMPDLISFENAFPGKISWQSVFVKSTFSHAMTVTSLTPLSDDAASILYEPAKPTPVLQPESINQIGKLYFDMRRTCLPNCYVGLPTSSQMGFQWLQGMRLTNSVSEVDGELLRTLQKRWVDLNTKLEGNRFNVTLQLETSEVRGFLMQAAVLLTWPLLTQKKRIRFPLTQVGNTTVKEVTLENPSSLPVIVQVVPVSSYIDMKELNKYLNGFLSEVMYDKLLSGSTSPFRAVFSLQDTEKYNTDPANPVATWRHSLHEYFDIHTHPDSLPVLMTPGMKLKVKLGFTPLTTGSASSIIIIRNNLTVLDYVFVEGTSSQGEIRLGNVLSDSSVPLLFDVSEKHLKDCDLRSRSSGTPTVPNLTVKRVFLARNTGTLPVYVSGFSISGSPCQGYGFKVMDCRQFLLNANETFSVDIAFTPDFTMSKVVRELQIHTNLRWELDQFDADSIDRYLAASPGLTLNFSLVAALPRHMLANCAAALPRPPWEAQLQYSTVVCMICVFVCVLLAAYFDSDRLFRVTFVSMTTSSPANNSTNYDKSKVFDLKSVGKGPSPNNNSCANHSKQNGFDKKDKMAAAATVTASRHPKGTCSKAIQNFALSFFNKTPKNGHKQHCDEHSLPNGHVPHEETQKKRCAKKNEKRTSQDSDKSSSEIYDYRAARGESAYYSEAQKSYSSRDIDALLAKGSKSQNRTKSEKKKGGGKAYVATYDEENSSVTTESSTTEQEVAASSGEKGKQKKGKGKAERGVGKENGVQQSQEDFEVKKQKKLAKVAPVAEIGSIELPYRCKTSEHSTIKEKTRANLLSQLANYTKLTSTAAAKQSSSTTSPVPTKPAVPEAQPKPTFAVAAGSRPGLSQSPKGWGSELGGSVWGEPAGSGDVAASIGSSYSAIVGKSGRGSAELVDGVKFNSTVKPDLGPIGQRPSTPRHSVSNRSYQVLSDERMPFAFEDSPFRSTGGFGSSLNGFKDKGWAMDIEDRNGLTKPPPGYPIQNGNNWDHSSLSPFAVAKEVWTNDSIEKGSKLRSWLQRDTKQNGISSQNTWGDPGPLIGWIKPDDHLWADSGKKELKPNADDCYLDARDFFTGEDAGNFDPFKPAFNWDTKPTVNWADSLFSTNSINDDNSKNSTDLNSGIM